MDPVYNVTVNDKFQRPLICFTPPKDDAGNRPRDIVKAFLSHIEKGDVEKASELVLFEPDSHGPTKSISIGKEGFERACQRFITFETGCEIVLSGSAINDKEDFWTIRYKTTAINGKEYDRAFVLPRRCGKWRILESVWEKWPGEDYDFSAAIKENKWVPLW